MDSKDSSLSSSSSSSMAGGRDAEEDGVLSGAAGLAKDASVAFHSGKFAECVDLLNHFFQKKETDPKVTLCVFPKSFEYLNCYFFCYCAFFFGVGGWCGVVVWCGVVWVGDLHDLCCFLGKCILSQSNKEMVYVCAHLMQFYRLLVIQYKNCEF